MKIAVRPSTIKTHAASWLHGTHGGCRPALYWPEALMYMFEMAVLDGPTVPPAIKRTLPLVTLPIPPERMFTPVMPPVVLTAVAAAGVGYERHAATVTQ